MFGMHDWFWGGWWALVMGIVWLGFWVLVIYLLVRAVRGRSGSFGSGSSALRILEERYARGEITREEFEERRGVLKGGSHT